MEKYRIVSSFCEFELEEIEQYLVQQKINYKVEKFLLNNLKCFHLYVDIENIDNLLDDLSNIEKNLIIKHGKPGYYGLFNVQELMQINEN